MMQCAYAYVLKYFHVEIALCSLFDFGSLYIYKQKNQSTHMRKYMNKSIMQRMNILFHTSTSCTT